MSDDFEYFSHKRINRTYISKAFDEFGDLSPFIPSGSKKIRIVSKVFDSPESHQFVNVKNELVIRVTYGNRQEIKAVFYEDSRDIKSITIQKYTKDSGKPHKYSFTFQGEEIAKLYNLIRVIKYIQLDKRDKTRFDDEILENLLISEDEKHKSFFKYIANVIKDDEILGSLSISEDEKRKFFLENIELVIELARNNITKSDVIVLAYRKKQLECFEQLLQSEEMESGWHQFFERNPWIFGYGLNYIFTSNLDNQKLERTIIGYSIQGSGKRVDALMKTKGLISSLCFVEIKTHKTPLLSPKCYRPECWQISDELAGSLSQVQKTVQKALENIRNKLEPQSKMGEPTGETVFLYQPRSCVVIGSLSEFMTKGGVNEQKYSSFELFRRNLVNPEIVIPNAN